MEGRLTSSPLHKWKWVWMGGWLQFHLNVVRWALTVLNTSTVRKAVVGLWSDCQNGSLLPGNLSFHHPHHSGLKRSVWWEVHLHGNRHRAFFLKSYSSHSSVWSFTGAALYPITFLWHSNDQWVAHLPVPCVWCPCGDCWTSMPHSAESSVPSHPALDQLKNKIHKQPVSHGIARTNCLPEHIQDRGGNSLVSWFCSLTWTLCKVHPESGETLNVQLFSFRNTQYAPQVIFTLLQFIFQGLAYLCPTANSCWK